MGFFSHAAMLGVGYWIGKSYCFRYKIHELQNEPNSAEYVLRVDRKEGPFWGSWHHHHCGWRHQGTMNQTETPKAKNPELLEVENK